MKKETKKVSRGIKLTKEQRNAMLYSASYVIEMMSIDANEENALDEELLMRFKEFAIFFDTVMMIYDNLTDDLKFKKDAKKATAKK